MDRTNWIGTLTVVAGKGLVDEQNVTIEYEISAGKRMVTLVLAGAATLFFLYLMVGAFRERDFVGAVLWSAAIAGLSWLYYRVLNIHVRIDGGRFSTRSLTGPEFQGGVEEFIGAEDNPTRAHWALLRRADLRVVQVPWDTHDRHSEADRRIGAWVAANFAAARVSRVRAIKKSTGLGKHQALSILSIVPNAAGIDADFLETAVDVRLSGAALCAARDGHVAARHHLLQLLLELPPRCVARQYVILALRTLANDEVRSGLVRSLSNEKARFFREQIVEALAHVATFDERTVLERLRDDEAPYIRAQARAALGRLGNATAAR